MGDHHREERESPDDGGKKPKRQKSKKAEKARSYFRDDAAENSFVICLWHKVHAVHKDHGHAFDSVLAYLLWERWNGVRIQRLMLTRSNQLIGCPQIEGGDMADMSPKPLLGLCSLERAIRRICELAEKAHLTTAERGYLLNRLPIVGRKVR